MPDLGGFIGWATLGLALGVAIVSLILRRIFELRWPTLSKHTPHTTAQEVWERIVLPTVPALLCASFCALVSPKDFDYPAVASRSIEARVIYGLVVGWFAAWGYQILTALIYRKWQVAAPMSSLTPDMTPESQRIVIIPLNAPPPSDRTPPAA